AAIGRRHVERLHHDDGVRRAHLHAELAELAGVQLERERLGVVPLLGLEHLDLDHLGRTDVLAEPAPDAVLFAGLLVVGQRQHAAVAVRVDTLDVRIVHGDRPANEIDQGDLHRTPDGRAQIQQLAPEALSLLPTHQVAPWYTTTTAVIIRRIKLAGSSSFHEIARIWSTRILTKLQRIHVTRRKKNIALSRNQIGPIHDGPGPDHAPRNRSAP